MLPSQYIETGWTQYVYARNISNEPVFFRSSESCSWCLEGAINAYYYHKYDINKLSRIELDNFLKEENNYRSLVLYKIAPVFFDLWNDAPERTKEEVVQLLKEVEKELELT